MAIHQRLTNYGCKPTLQKLDSKISQLLIKYHQLNDIDL